MDGVPLVVGSIISTLHLLSLMGEGFCILLQPGMLRVQRLKVRERECVQGQERERASERESTTAREREKREREREI